MKPNKNIENIAELCLKLSRKYDVQPNKVINDVLTENRILQRRYASKELFCYNALGVVSNFYKKYGER